MLEEDFFEKGGMDFEEEGGGDGVPAPTTPLPQADLASSLQMEEDAFAAHAATVAASQQIQDDEDAKAILAAEYEEAIAQAALEASAKQNIAEWQIEGPSQAASNQVKFEDIMTTDDRERWRQLPGESAPEKEEYAKRLWSETYAAIPENDISRRGWMLWTSTISMFAIHTDWMTKNVEVKYAEGLAMVKQIQEDSENNKEASRPRRAIT